MDNEFKIYNNPGNTARERQLAERVYWMERQRQAGFWLFTLLLIVVLSGVVFVFFAMPASGGHKAAEVIPAGSSSAVTDPGIVREIRLLKGQMGTLITDSLEAKVTNLEKNLQDGIISESDLAAVRELKSDLRVLKTYSLQSSLDSMGLLPPVISRPQRNLLESEHVLNELASMKSLFYLTMAPWGVMLVVIGGVWLHGYYRIRQLENAHWAVRELIDKSGPGF